MRTVFRITAPILCMCAALLSLVARADDEAAVSEKLGRIIKETKLRHRDIEHFFVVEVRMSTGYLQEVFVTKQAHFLGEEPFVEITAVGWRWENATEFSRQNANWLLEASTTTKVGGWQALKFEDENSVAAEFKATIPLDSRPQTFEAVIKGVASSAFELHDLMDE